MIVGGLFDESRQRCGDPPRNRLRVNRSEGAAGLQCGSNIVDPIESRFPRGELWKVVAPDRPAVLLWGSGVDDELAGRGKYPRRLASKPGEVEVRSPSRHQARRVMWWELSATPLDSNRIRRPNSVRRDIVWLRLTALSDAQHGVFTTGTSPMSCESVS